jgi:Putative adhesin
MKLKLAFAVSLLALSTAAFADSTFQRTIQTSGQADLYVSTGSGNIHITPGGGSEIRITGHVHAGWSAFGDVASRVQKIVDNPPISQSGNTVHVGDSSDHTLYNNISIDYEVSAPADVALNLRSGSGDIEVNNVGRYLSATSGSGNIRAHGVHGPAELETGSGDIELGQNGPGAVRAKTGSGNVQLHGFDGTLYARTGSGDIEAEGHLNGASSVSTGSGNARLHLATDSRFNLEASTGSGDIKVNMPGAPQPGEGSRHHYTAAISGGGPALEIRTGSGDIVVTPR